MFDLLQTGAINAQYTSEAIKQLTLQQDLVQATALNLTSEALIEDAKVNVLKLKDTNGSRIAAHAGAQAFETFFNITDTARLALVVSTSHFHASVLHTDHHSTTCSMLWR